METRLDCRGLACPGPVLACKKCVDGEHPETLTVTVDNQAARENVCRFLTMKRTKAAATVWRKRFLCRDGQGAASPMHKSVGAT